MNFKLTNYLRFLPRSPKTTPMEQVKNNLKKHQHAKKKLIILGTGSYNPGHNMHIKMFKIAKEKMEQKGYTVIGGFISPAHDDYTTGKLGENSIHSKHRIKILNKLIKSFKQDDWLCVDKAEVMHKNIVFITHALFSLRNYFEKKFGANNQVHFMYLCGKDLFLRAAGFDCMQQAGFGVIVLDRQTDINFQSVLHMKNGKYKYVINMDSKSDLQLSSSLIRKCVHEKLEIDEELLCKEAYQYVLKHKLIQ